MMDGEFNILARITALAREAQEDLSGSCFEDLRQAFARIPERLASPMQLAIVGKISSSKSTLVNAILGQPEVVRTGAMEETWNVSWLKYGDPEGDVVVHYKKGTSERISRKEWGEWANRKRDDNEQLRDTVSYIEVTSDQEILKQINIIDTPGLDSFYGTDSRNTLDFLRQVRPDAVIMLFAKSINADTLGIIEDFRQGVGNGFLPINAMGVMSKIDEIWASDPELDPLREAHRVIDGLRSQEVVRNTLFDIYPVTAMLALCVSSATEEDLRLFKALSRLDGERFKRLLKSERRFLAAYEDVEVSEERRAELLAKYGRYGIYLVVEYLRRNGEDASLEGMRQMLLQKSGFDAFMKVVREHFGERAALIKNYSSLYALSVRCHQEGDRLCRRSDSASIANRLLLNKVLRKVDEVMEVLYVEFQKVDFLIEMYEGKLELEEEEYEELRRVCGEYGASCLNRIGLPEGATVGEMVSKVSERLEYWMGNYNSVGILFPSRARFMKLFIDSYRLLLNDIRTAQCKLDAASRFLYGK